MRLSILAVGSLCMALGLGFAPGCEEDDDNNVDAGTGGRGGTGGTGGSTGGTGGGTGGTGGSTGGTGGSTGGTGGSTGGTGGAAATTYATVQPIFMAKCTPCHATGGTQGLPKFASMFSEANKNVVTGALECGNGVKVGACTITRIKSGSMPSGKMCKPEAGQPPNPSMCLTAAEEATIQAWVSGGLKEM